MLRKIKNFSNRFKNQKGFNLIELIVIIVVMGIVTVPLTQLITTNQKAVGDISLYIQGEFFTQSVMEEIIADYKSNARGYDWVINNWSGASRSHPDLSMNAQVNISQVVDADTGIHYAVVVVSVKPGSGFSRIELTSHLVDDE